MEILIKKPVILLLISISTLSFSLAQVQEIDEVKIISNRAQNENGIKKIFHSSSTLNEKKASWADLIYFFDFEIYDHLIQKFPKHKSKFQLFGKNYNGLIINDPINVSKKDYAFIMKNVYTSAQLNLKSFNK